MAKKPKQTTTPDAEWIDARIRDVVGTTAEVSRRVFGHKDIMARVLTGSRKLKTPELIEIAKALQIPVALLLRKLGYDVPGGECDVVGIVGERAKIKPLPPKATAKVGCPVDIAAETDLVAVKVDAPASALALFHGAYFFFSRPKGRGVEPGALGHVSIIEIGESTQPLVGVLDRSSVNTATVTLFCTDERIETAELVSATPVRWIKIG